jgi:Rab-GTPase-TBC domain
MGYLNAGYVQGMSDLLSVVYAIMQDDSDAFWCFCGFMDRMVHPFFLQELMAEIQFFDESDRDEKTTRHTETFNSAYDPQVIQPPRKIRFGGILLPVPATSSLVQTGILMG